MRCGIPNAYILDITMYKMHVSCILYIVISRMYVSILYIVMSKI